MTTALSPDSRILIHMIFKRATQNAVWPMSPQPLSSMLSHVAGSAICPIESTGTSSCSPRRRADVSLPPLPQANLQAKPGGWPARFTPRAVPSPSPDDFVAGEELGNFLLRRLRRIRAVHRILADRSCMNLADRACRRLGRIGHSHDLAIFRDGILAFEHLHHHRPGNHELDELAEEGPLAVDRIKRLRLLAADAHAFLRDDAQTGLLDHGVDRAGQIAGRGIRFDDRKGTLARHGMSCGRVAVREPDRGGL